jgi:hypothetical protein
MTMELDREVSITRDLPEYGLRAGDSAFVGVGVASALAEASPWRIEMRSILFHQTLRERL